MVKQVTEILELILKIFGVIGGLVGAVVFILKWWKSYTARMNQFFTGKWRNEGDILHFPSHYIELDLTAEGNDINGCFNVRKADEEHTWHGVTISGKRYFHKVKCKIQHIRHGEILTYGTVTLNKKGKNMKWELKEGVADFFPREEMLFK